MGATKNVENEGDSNEVYTQSLHEAEFGTKVKTRVTVTPYPSRIQAKGDLKENTNEQVYKTTPRNRNKLYIDQIHVSIFESYSRDLPILWP